MQEKRLILGIDVSTTCTGVSILSVDGEETKVLYIDRVKFKNNKQYKGTDALFFKSKQFIEEFIEKYKDLGFTDIVIEEPLPSSQNVGTVNTLMKFNGMLSQAIFQATNVIPQYISSYDARKYAFPELMAVRKFNKKGETYPKKHVLNALKKGELTLFGAYPFDCKKKHILWNLVSERYPDIKWVYDKNGELKTENFDASDSLVCILGFLNAEKYKNIPAKMVHYQEYNNIILYNNKNNFTRFEYEFEFCGKTIKKSIEIPENDIT